MNTVLQILTLLGSLGMFLYGMSLMSGGLQKMAGEKLRSFMASMTSTAFKRVLTGIVVTALVQSSTATTLMLVSFVNAGLLSLANAIGVIMGANIGTTVTAWIFALSFGGGSFSFGAIAVPLMFFAFLLLSIKKEGYNNAGEFLMGFALLFLGLSTLSETSTTILDNEPVRVFLSHLTGFGVGSIILFMVAGAAMTLMLQSSAATTDFALADESTKIALIASLPFCVAVLHSFFNIVNTMILIWFVPQIEKVVTWLVPNPEGGEEVFRLKFIQGGPLNTAELSLNEAKQEIVHFGNICKKGFGYVRSAINASEDGSEQFIEKLVKYEEITDNIEFEIASYLSEVGRLELSPLSTSRIKGMYRIIGELESLGDSGEAISRMLSRARNHDCRFDDALLRKMNKMMDYVDVAYDAMLYNLELPLGDVQDISNAQKAESDINAYRDILREEHMSNIDRADYNYPTGVFYMDIINELEKIGDFIINISQAQMLENKI